MWILDCELRIAEDGDQLQKGGGILGDSEFVLDMLKKTDEKFDRYRELKRPGYYLQRVEENGTPPNMMDTARHLVRSQPGVLWAANRGERPAPAQLSIFNFFFRMAMSSALASFC